MKHTQTKAASVVSADANFHATESLTIHPDFVARLEHLDATLRSIPLPRSRIGAEVEAARAESIIKKLFN